MAKANTSTIMRRAWEIARYYANKTGDKPMVYMKYAMENAWKERKSQSGILRKTPRQMREKRKQFERKIRNSSKYRTKTDYQPRMTEEEYREQRIKNIEENGFYINKVIQALNDLSTDAEHYYSMLPSYFRSRITKDQQIGKHFEIEDFYTGDYEEIVSDATKELEEMAVNVRKMTEEIYEKSNDLTDDELKDLNYITNIAVSLEKLLSEIRSRDVIFDVMSQMDKYYDSHVNDPVFAQGMRELGFNF